MLSTKAIKSVSDSAHYYASTDNYYTQEEGIAKSEWYGKASERLRLQGEMDPAQFTLLLEGKLPNGEILGKVVDGKIHHRPGWDLTLSVPKSISIMALSGGDKRLVDAHIKAAKTAFSEIERGCSEVRIKQQGEMSYQMSKNLVGGLFHHDLSRARDMQIHTHMVVMNMSQRRDGLWRSLASKIGRYDQEVTGVHGFIERVRHHQSYYGKLYEAELAYQVKQLGYEIVVNPETGVFEIAGVPKEVIEHFSKRREKIKEELVKKGLSGAKAAEIAALNTRDKKKNVDRAELFKEWKEDIKNLGFDIGDLKLQAEQRANTKSHTMASSQSIHGTISMENDGALSVVQKAIQELTVFKTTFTLEDVIRTSATFAIQNEVVDLKNLLQSVQRCIDKGDLLSLENTHGKSFYMAKSTLEDEKRIQAVLKANETIHSKIDINHILSQQHFSHAEKRVITDMFSNEKHVMIEGQATKDFFVHLLPDIIRSEGLSVAVVSPNQIASKKIALNVQSHPVTLWEKMKSWFLDEKVEHSSTAAFLVREQERIPQLLLVDQAHLLSAKEQADLLEWGSNHNTKMIFFSERDKLLSQRKGLNTDFFTQHGMKTVTLDEKHVSNEAMSVEVVANTIEKIASHVVDVPAVDDRLHAMAKQFSRLENRSKVFLVGNNKATVEQLNQLAHDELKQAGKLQQSILVNALLPVFISEGRRSEFSAYPTGHQLRFCDTSRKLGVQWGEYVTIVGHDHKTNEVLLKKSNEKIIRWKPDASEQRVELYQEVSREWSMGERLKCHRSFGEGNLVKGENAVVRAISKNKVTLENEEGKKIVIDMAKAYHRHFDYAYAGTPHQLAHEKAEHFIVDLTAGAFSTDQRRFLQLASQPKNLTVYTDDAKILWETLEKRTGNKLSAHEVLQSSEDVKKNFEAFYTILHKAIQKPGEDEVALSQKAVNAVDYAIHHLVERKAGFDHKELMKTAVTYAIGDVNKKELLTALDAMEKAGVILRGQDSDGTLWTTQDAIKMEREIIALATQDQGKFTPMLTDEKLNELPERLHLEQINAIKTIATSCDRVLPIQGRAGTGKTTMMAALQDVLATKDMLNAEGYTLIGIGPTHKSVKELQKGGLEARTIDRFLLDMRHLQDKKYQHDFSKTVLIVDESSMVSNRKMADILRVVHDFNFRLMVPTGDRPQLAAIEAGKPDDLIQRSIDAIYLDNIQRQKNPILKKAVESIYQGKVKEAFTVLGGSVIEINEETIEKARQKETRTESKYEQKKDGLHTGSYSENKEKIQNQKKSPYQQRLEAISKDYVSLIKQGEDVQMIVPSHEDRIAVNAQTRMQLSQAGLIHEKEHVCSILSSKDMTQVERSNAGNFNTNHIVRFNTSFGKHIKSGEYFRIKQIDPAHNILVLTKMDEQKSEVIWQVPRSRKRLNTMVEVFKQEERKLSVGDKILWMRTNQKDGMLSTDVATITHVEGGKMTVLRSDNSTLVFHKDDPKYQHWDHAYAITAHASQGGTYSTVLALFESYRKRLMNHKTFLVTLTRAVNTVRIYTDRKKDLVDRIARNTGDKLSSLEVIGEYPVERRQKYRNKSMFNNAKDADKNSKKPDYSTHNKAKDFSSHFDKLMIERIKECLNRDAENIAVELLGKPKVRGNNFLKFGGNQGSLSITTKGEKQGWWNDFADTEAKGRSMLSFIEKYAGLSKKDAIEYGAKRFGIMPHKGNKSALTQTQSIRQKTQNATIQETEYQQKMSVRAQKLAGESQPIVGTLAETYLKKVRGIDGQVRSNDVRFHPNIYSSINKQSLPALLNLVRDKENNVISVEAVYLDPKTGDKAKDIKVGKQTFGSKKGGAVLVNQGKREDTVVLTEGVVTGLSVAKALPDVTVKSVLGMKLLSHIDPASLPKNVVMCLDFDGKDVRQDKSIREAAERLIAHDKQVKLMVPHGLKQSKFDYNDVLKSQGQQPIKDDFLRAVSYQEFYQTQPTTTQKLQVGLQAIVRQQSQVKSQRHTQAIPLSSNDMTKLSNHLQHEMHRERGQINRAVEAVQARQAEYLVEQPQTISKQKTIQIEREI